MVFISITRLRIRSIRYMPAFALQVLKTRRQVTWAAGFRQGALLADRAWTFWTLTVWDSQEAMRTYMMSGAHAAIMPRLADWCDEASVAHGEQPDDAPPSWPEADRRMRESGRAAKVRHPSPRHADLSYRPPRVTGSAPINPKSS